MVPVLCAAEVFSCSDLVSHPVTGSLELPRNKNVSSYDISVAGETFSASLDAVCRPSSSTDPLVALVPVDRRYGEVIRTYSRRRR